MSDAADNPTPQEADPAEPISSRFHQKKILFVGGAAMAVSIIAASLAVWLLAAPDKAVEAPKPPAAAGHRVVIAPAVKAPSHAGASAPAASAADALQAEIRALEREKKKLLEEQIKLLKQQKADFAKKSKSIPVGGVKECQLSGDKSTRTQELRACFGLPSADHGHAEETHVHAEWAYSGPKGPEYWGKLKPEFSACDSGRQQSPINIVGSGKKGAPELKFDYRPSALKLVNNGHTLQVNYDKGSFIRVDGQPYELVQFHFHTPSEELINGRMADMTVHLVHKHESGKLAVVGVLMETGKEHSGLSVWWDRLPSKPGPEIGISELKVDAGRLLPAAKDQYYSFEGSLTTPPCTEGVRWFVMKTPMTLSDAQLKRFVSLYPYNARPVQPRYERVVWER